MIFAEPPVTRFDVRLRLARVPVRIHPFFWLTTFGVAFHARTTALGLGVWMVAVLVSILVHEMGHAATYRRFGCEPRITLYGLGGLASADEGADLTWRRRILVAAAGPFAGFLLASLLVGGLVLAGFRVPLFTLSLGDGAPITHEALALLVDDLVFINVVWGCVNLLPVHPLDGGQIAREIACHFDAEHGVERSVWLSLFVGAAVTLGAAIVYRDLFVTLLFGYLAFSSWRVLTLQYGAGRGHGAMTGVRSRWAAWRAARQRRAVQKRIGADLRKVESLDDEDAAPDVVRATDAAWKAVADKMRAERAKKP